MKAFPSSRYYLSELAVREAIAQQRMFNLLDNDLGEKADFWLLTDGEFDISRFSRRIEADVAGAACFVSTPEDTILQKLVWSDLYGGSEKQMIDALRVFELQHDRLDMAYLAKWVDTLNLRTTYQELCERARR